MKILVIGCSGYQGYVVGVAERLKSMLTELEMTLVLVRDPLHKVEVLSKRTPYTTKILLNRDSVVELLVRTYREMDKYSLFILGCPRLYPLIHSIFRISKKVMIVLIESGYNFTIPYISYYIPDPVILQWPEQRMLYSRGVVVGPIYESPLYNVSKGDLLSFIVSYRNYRLLEAISCKDVYRVLEDIGEPVFIGYDRGVYVSKIGVRNVIDAYSIDLDSVISRSRVVVTDDPYLAIYSSLSYGKSVVLAKEFIDGYEYINARTLAKKLNIEYVCVDKGSVDAIIRAIYNSLKKSVKSYGNGGAVLAKKLIDILL